MSAIAVAHVFLRLACSIWLLHIGSGARVQLQVCHSFPQFAFHHHRTMQPDAVDAACRATWQARAFSADNRILFARWHPPNPPLSITFYFSSNQLCSLFSSDAFSEFKELVAVQLDDTLRDFKEWLRTHPGDASGFTPALLSCTRISSHIPWDVCGASFQKRAKTPLIAAIFNVDGRRELFM